MSQNDDSVINLRNSTSLNPRALSSKDEASSVEPGNRVKVTFEKFANLVATHAYEDIVSEHKNSEIIISTDLLADLANAHEDSGEKKIPLMFVLGAILGVVLTWFLIKY